MTTKTTEPTCATCTHSNAIKGQWYAAMRQCRLLGFYVYASDSCPKHSANAKETKK